MIREFLDQARLVWGSARPNLKKLQKNGLTIGKDVWLGSHCFLDPSHCHLITIGSGCTICAGTRILAHDASTKRHLGSTKIGPVTVGDNVFIGAGSILLPNVTIGDNAIIGAGSVVTKHVPPGEVWAGNPARFLCTLDSYLAKYASKEKPGTEFME